MHPELPTTERLQYDLGISTEIYESECCIADERAALRPSERVQQKFISLTRDLPLTISSLQTRRTVIR